MSAVRQFIVGFHFFKLGWLELQRNSKLRYLAIVPMFLGFFLFVFGFIWGTSHLGTLATEVLLFILPASVQGWSQWLLYPLVFLFGVVYLVLLIYFIYIFGLLIAAPFMGLLAEKILRERGIKADISLFSMIKVAVYKIIFFGMLGIALFICSFIPGLNLVSSFGVFLILAFDSMDYAFEAHGLTLSSRLRFFRQRFPLFLGMASALGLTLFVPGLTLLILPFAVSGAAVLYRESIV